MASGEPAHVVSSEVDLVAQLGCGGRDGIDHWLRERCEFADAFDDDGGEARFRRVAFFYGNGVSAIYTIELGYPFLLSAFVEEADRAELHFAGAIAASSLTGVNATLGCPGSEGDVSTDVAENVLGGVPVADLVAALGGQWREADLAWDQGSNGEGIFAWFVPTDGRLVAFGVGADELFIVPLLGDEEVGYRVEEWPDPTVRLWWTGEWEDGVPAGDPGLAVDQLRAAIATVGQTGQA